MTTPEKRWPVTMTCADCDATITDPTDREMFDFVRDHYRATTTPNPPKPRTGEADA